MTRRPPSSPLFPYPPLSRSLPELETLHRRYRDRGLTVIGISVDGPRNFARVRPFAAKLGLTFPIVLDEDGRLQQLCQDRKSTRLNSSHGYISYAVFCLKKKN